MSSIRRTRPIERVPIVAGGLTLLAACYQRLLRARIGRGGAYTYDWIERILGLEMQSAEKIVPAGMAAMEVGSLVMERRC